MKAVINTTLALAFLATNYPALADQSFDGDWKGEGISNDSDCPGFDFWVSVKDQQVEGIAHQTGTDYQVTGELSDDGEFTGTVTYLFMEIAELNGDIRGDESKGQWKALMGPSCDGEFVAQKY